MPDIQFPKLDNIGLIRCACGKNSTFGRADVVQTQIVLHLEILGECGECLDKKADEAESQKIKQILEPILTEKPNVANGNPAPALGSPTDQAPSPTV